MKVLVISHTYITGINRDKWKVFASKYNDVHLTVVFPKQWPTHLFNHQATVLEKEHSSNCCFIALDAFNVGNEVKYGYYSRPLLNLLKTFQPDVVHVEQGVCAFSYFQVILYAWLLGLKTKFSFFTWVNWKQKNSLKYRLFWKPIEKINLFFSRGAVVGNHAAKEILCQSKELKIISVIPQLGVSQHVFKPVESTVLRDPNKKYIGFIGRITHEKGIFLLAQAFAEIQQDFPMWNLLFVGTGPESKQLIDYAVEQRLLDRIEFRNPVPHEQVAQILYQIDILVLPSYDTAVWKEQFGHVLIEAMACKVPVLGSTGGEIPQVIADGGLVFDQKDRLDLMSKLKMLMENEILRKELGEKGFERMKNNYSHEVIAQKTYAFWQGLVE
ncbi:MAG: glycosyltransferase [bacterium]